MIYTVFNYLGNFAPFILLLFSLYLLSNKQNLQFYYLVGLLINTILNLVLKGIIQQPRPFEDEKKFNFAVKNIPETIFKDGIPFNIFGMPSGHAQMALYSTVYIYLSLKNINVLLFYIFMSLIIIVQRVISKSHSIFQVVVGAFIGSFMGYTAFYFAETVIKGRIREKPDDFGPL
jgi:membrane-associated phospholipid phosphatase